ncbi:uncharacterized protein GIQ15_02530 [Arthroderma uncinatum]|uniref:uncharacterized protein n=1 Tax=Arthroderma uncinatum TaxID=74035 RepID=UPI00144A8ECE|nr:uncharacterized protein GIQ15_02530 [Arthroderma uncinatum]KAF3483206.1 hypothetical protein GIQ15_02530 [Arthroderma uncinatum]
MAITELAVLKLRPAALTADNKPNETTTSFLRGAKQGMESYTGFPFYIFTQLEDPAYVYIVGNWESLSQHYDDWIPSDANQGLLESGKDLFDIAGLAHLDIDQQELGLPCDSPMLALGWFHMLPEQKEAFIKAWEANVPFLKQFTAPHTVRSGWRIDGERKVDGKEVTVKDEGEPEVEEFVAFTGWRDVSHNDSFAQSEGFSQHQQLVDHVTKVEMKRLVKLDL